MTNCDLVYNILFISCSIIGICFIIYVIFRFFKEKKSFKSLKKDKFLKVMKILTEKTDNNEIIWETEKEKRNAYITRYKGWWLCIRKIVKPVNVECRLEFLNDFKIVVWEYPNLYIDVLSDLYIAANTQFFKLSGLSSLIKEIIEENSSTEKNE